MPSIPETVVERDWEADEDANTLARANEIMQDPVRLNKAKVAATNLAAERMEQVKALLSAAGRTFNQTYKGFEISADQSSIE